jgi:hypothetical protein
VETLLAVGVEAVLMPSRVIASRSLDEPITHLLLGRSRSPAASTFDLYFFEYLFIP